MKHFALFLYNDWGIASSPGECASLSKTVKDDLLSAGFVSNGDKSVWEPCQSIFSLGINFYGIVTVVLLKPVREELRK